MSDTRDEMNERTAEGHEQPSPEEAADRIAESLRAVRAALRAVCGRLGLTAEDGRQLR